ncbi:MAG: AMIN-like domain-containing (lipo)protein [Pauljensenia sp.]
MSHPAHPARHAVGSLVLVSCLALGMTACSSSPEQSGEAESGPSGASTQSGSEQSGTASSSTPEATSSPTASADPEAEESAATSPILGDRWTQSASSQEPVRDPDGDGLVFHAMRVADHEGFYRVVLEFSGTGQPGWDTSWSDQPVEQGRGLPLDVTGAAFLDLRITGTTMPVMEGQVDLYYSGPASLTVGPINVVEDGTFEDQTHVVIGMDDVRDFQVGTLDDPARVVIDVKK